MGKIKRASTAKGPASAKPAAPQMTDEMREFFRRMGSQGGRLRAKKYTRKDFSRWGKKGRKAQLAKRKP